MSNFKKIAVIYGGPSSEAEVSVNTAKAVDKALKNLGYNSELIEFSKDLSNILSSGKFDVVYNAMHGLFGEDGALQGLCEVMQIPYTHSGVRSSAIAMNKNFTKNILMFRNIPMPGDYLFSRDDLFNKQLPIPCVIKPLNEGSSLGILIVKDDDDDADVSKLNDDEMFLVEDYLAGRELTVAVLDGKALGVLEIKPKSGVYDYKSKYTSGATEYIVPARLPKDVERKALEFAETAHKSLGCKGVTRTDFIYADRLANPQVYFLEINTHPGMTETSLVPKIAEYANINFEELVEKILKSAKCELS